jgi:hypothetical protein
VRQENQVNPFRRLNELTAIKNDFEDTREAVGGPLTPKQQQASRHHRELVAGIARVSEERGGEVGRLLEAGHTGEELSAQLDRTDRHRHR